MSAPEFLPYPIYTYIHYASRPITAKVFIETRNKKDINTLAIPAFSIIVFPISLSNEPTLSLVFLFLLVYL